jgi:cytoskeletal protein CcmA (bactofilin family)
MPTADTLHEAGPMNSSSTPKSVVDERRVTAWIGQGVAVEGKITSTQDLRIDGKVDGTIEVGNHALVIGANAAVKANLIARSIVISGTVTGNVTASERVDVQATASVEGDVRSPRLVMVEGAVVKGKVEAGRNRTTKTQGG